MNRAKNALVASEREACGADAKLWLLDIGCGLADRDFQRWQSLLPPPRRERLEQFHFRADAERTLAGEILAKCVLGMELGVPAATIRFVHTPTGKPELAGGGAHFNISHSGSLVACAVADRPVGADVEAITPLESGAAAFFASEAELALLREDNADPALAILLWTLKESLVKARGTGIDDSLRTVDFSRPLSEWSGGTLRIAAGGYRLHAFRHGAYMAAVCREWRTGDAADVAMRVITPGDLAPLLLP